MEVVEGSELILTDAPVNGMNGTIKMEFRNDPLNIKIDSTQIISLADGTDIRLDALEEIPLKPALNKVLHKANDINDALDQTLDGNDEDYQESDEEGSEEDDISGGEEPNKKPRLDEDSNLRKSGRERKIPKKFDIPPQSKKRSHKKKEAEEDSDVEEFTDDKKRKRGREKNPPKPKPTPKAAKDEASPRKLVRKKKKLTDAKKKGDESDGSEEEIVSKSFKKRLKQKSQAGAKFCWIFTTQEEKTVLIFFIILNIACGRLGLPLHPSNKFLTAFNPPNSGKSYESSSSL